MTGCGYERPIKGGQSVTALPWCSDADLLGDVDLEAKVLTVLSTLVSSRSNRTVRRFPRSLVDQSRLLAAGIGLASQRT
jgi:hypothetical protein